MPNACALNCSADKLGLTDAVGRKAGSKVRVFFLGHACFDYSAAVRRVVSFAGHWLHLLSLIAVFGANLHPITGSNSQGFSRAESPLLYNRFQYVLPHDDIQLQSDNVGLPHCRLHPMLSY